MRITNVGENKFTVETSSEDIEYMESRMKDVVMGEITRGLISTIKEQILADEKYINEIKEEIKNKLNGLKIENINFNMGD